MLWHVDPLLGGDYEIVDCTVVRKQQKRNGVLCVVHAEMLQAGQFSFRCVSVATLG
jgi:hypothetical protein